MNQPTFRVHSLRDLVILLEKCPPTPHVPTLLYQFWEYNGCDPRKRNGEKNGELMEEENMLILYVFGKQERPERRDRVHD